MASTLTCPGCQATLQVGNVATGQQVNCPRCQALVTVPRVDPVAVTLEPTPEAGAGPTRPCPRCGQPITLAARKCRHCKAWLEDDDDDEVYRPRFKPCPRCGATGASRVVFTFWGSFYGPALFTHVRCPRCGCAYNGKTGRSNFIPALLFVTIPAVLILGIVGGVIYVVVSSLR